MILSRSVGRPVVADASSPAGISERYSRARPARPGWKLTRHSGVGYNRAPVLLSRTSAPATPEVIMPTSTARPGLCIALLACLLAASRPVTAPADATAPATRPASAAT